MKNRRVLTIVLVVVLSTVILSVGCAEPATRPITDARSTTPKGAEPAGRQQMTVPWRIRITWDPATLPLDQKRIIHTLNNLTNFEQDEVQKYVKEYSITSVSFQPCLRSEQGATKRGFLVGNYEVELTDPNKQTQAGEFVKAVVERMQKLLVKEHKVSRERIIERCNYAEREQGEAKARLRDIRKRLLVLTDESMGRDVSWRAEKNKAFLSQIEREFWQLDIEIAAKGMRLEAVREQIARIGRETAAATTAAQRKKIVEELARYKRKLEESLNLIGMTEKHPTIKALRAKIALLEAALKKSKPTAARTVRDDPITVELDKIVEKIVEARMSIIRPVITKVVNKELSKGGHIDMSIVKPPVSKAARAALAEAEAAFAEVKIQLARRREEVLRATTGGLELLRRLKTEQTFLVIDIREMKIRQSMMERQLGRASSERKKLLAKLRDRERLIMQMEQIKTVDLPLAVKQYEKATLRVDKLNQELRSLAPPTVTIVK